LLKGISSLKQIWSCSINSRRCRCKECWQ